MAFVGDDCGKPLDLIEPTEGGWHEVHVPVRPLREPGAHFGYCGSRSCPLCSARRGAAAWPCRFRAGKTELLMPGARLAAGKRRPVEHVQRRKQRCASVAAVVMRDAFDVAKTHREPGLSACSA